MQTVLESGLTWFLGVLLYDGCAEELRIDLLEGFQADEPEDLEVRGVRLWEKRRLSWRESSRRVRVTFTNVCAYQSIGESYTALDEYEQGDHHFLSTLSRSRFRDFVSEHYPILPATTGSRLEHYRLWTETEVVDVIATKPPEVAEVVDS